MTDEIKQLKLDTIEPHPDNPRLFLRQDVIDGIAAQIEANDKEFDPAHALLVRPVNGHYQILRGHHRIEAARKVGLDAVPCWVREMGDDEAYMQLVLSNVQGELSPLEIGVHALGIDFDKRGMGASGDGLSGYAGKTGHKKQNISLYRNGAEVLSISNLEITNGNILDKAKHFGAIHKTPQQVWPILVNWVITPKDSDKPDSTPTVKQVDEQVKKVNKFEIPERWQGIFLSLPDVVTAFIRDGKPTPDITTKLISEADKIEKVIAANEKKDLDPDKFPYTVEAFHKWLADGIGGLSWNVIELQGYSSQVIEAVQEATKPPDPEPQPGEWWELGDHLLYCGDTGQPEFWESLPEVPFIFADPPYNAGTAEWDEEFKWNHNWLADKGDMVAVTPGIEAIDRFFKEDAQMPYRWSMACHITNGMTRGKLGYGNWIYIALFSGLESINKKAKDIIEVAIKTASTDETEHKGRKPSELLDKLLDIFTDREETIIDPFLGSGTTLFAAERLGRSCIGGEIRPKFCKDIIIRWQEETGREAIKAGE